MAAISFAFIIARAAEMLGEDEEWLEEISISMDPEDGRLRVIGIGVGTNTPHRASRGILRPIAQPGG